VFALDALPRHTVLCEYAGHVRTQKLVRTREPRRRRRTTVNGRRRPRHSCAPSLAAQHHAYVDQMEPTLQEQKTVVLNWYASARSQPCISDLINLQGRTLVNCNRCSTSDWDPDDAEPLVIDGSIQGNISCKFNDCRLDPFTAKRKGTVCSATGGYRVNVFSSLSLRWPSSPRMRPQAPPLDAAPANCRFVEVILFDWPHVFLMTLRDIAPGMFRLGYGGRRVQTPVPKRGLSGTCVH